jgi:hypothetical protein
LAPALSYAEIFSGAESEYAAVVIENIPSDILVPTGYTHRMSVNVSFNGLVYNVYVRVVQGRCFIGLQLKRGQGSIAKDLVVLNFAAAVQFLANELNTNAVLRAEFNRVTNLGISDEGVAMIDFVGFPPGVTTQESVQGLYRPVDTSSGLVGVYSVEDLHITSEGLSTVQQDIKAAKLFKLDEPEKFYEVEVTYERLSNTDFINRAVSVKKSKEATTIILNINNFDATMLSSEATREILKRVIEIVHDMGMTVTIEIKIEKATEEIFRLFLELGFDGISIDAQNMGTEDIEKLKRVLEALIRVSSSNSISEKNTIHLKNKDVRELLGNLSSSNILTITNVDPETQEANVDEEQALDAIEVGYERGRRVLEQNVRVEAENIRALLGIFNRNHTSITVNEIRKVVRNAGLGPVLQKHVESLLKGLGNDVTGENYRVAQAIGFVRGLVESYGVGMYLDTFDMSFETFRENDLNDRRTLVALLAALFIIDTNNTFFKDTTALKTFFKQANTVSLESSTDETFSSARQQIIIFTNSIIERFEEEKDITDLALNQGNPSERLYISLAIINYLINKVSFRRIVDETGKRAKASASAVRSILGAA